MSLRPLLLASTFIAALLSAAMPSSGRMATLPRLGHEAAARVDRLAEHAAPWRAGITTALTAVPTVADRATRDGGAAPSGAALTARPPFALAPAHDVTRSSPHRAAPAPHTARHRVGFDATAPPLPTHRLA